MDAAIEHELDKIDLSNRDTIRILGNKILEDGHINRGRFYVLCYIIKYTKKKTGINVVRDIFNCIWNNIIMFK